MPLQSMTSEELSFAESDALARFVHDLRLRMTSVVELLQERGSPQASGLAGSISENLGALEEELAPPNDRPH